MRLVHALTAIIALTASQFCALSTIAGAFTEEALIQRYNAFSGWSLGDGKVSSIRIRARQGSYSLLYSAETGHYVLQYYREGQPYAKVVWANDMGALFRGTTEQHVDQCVFGQFVAEVTWLTGAFTSIAPLASTDSELKVKVNDGTLAIWFEKSGAPSAAAYSCGGTTFRMRAVQYGTIGGKLTFIKSFVRGSEPEIQIETIRVNDRIYPGEYEIRAK